MKAKTIAKEIKAKINDWLITIDNSDLREEIAKEVIVTGGCIASMFLKEPVNDYDLYLRTPHIALKIACYYVEKMIDSGSFKIIPMIKVYLDDGSTRIFRVKGEFSGSGDDDGSELNKSFPLVDKCNFDFLDKLERVEIYVKSQGFAAECSEKEYKYFENEPQENTAEFFEGIAKKGIETGLTYVDKPADEKDKYRPVFISSNAISLSNDLQIVLRFTGEPKKIHESYDFLHATNYWTEEEGLVTNSEALECLLSKELRYMGSLFPLASIFRTRKFIIREWSCHIGNYLKMSLQLNDFDLTDPEVLREQLTGVDAAYLHEIITAVRNKQKEDPNFEFTSTYICEIVERFMG